MSSYSLATLLPRCHRSVNEQHELRTNVMDIAGGKYRSEYCCRCYFGRVIQVSPPPPRVLEEAEEDGQ